MKVKYNSQEKDDNESNFECIKRKRIKTGRIKKIPLECKGPKSNKIGRNTERRFARLMSDHMAQVEWLVQCVKTTRTVDLHSHIDFDLIFSSEATGIITVGVQVKSGRYCAQKFSIEHPNIPVIIAGIGQTDEEIIKQVEDIYNSICNH